VAYRDQYELYARSQLTQVSRVLDLAHALTDDLQYELYTHQALRDAISELWATTRRFRDTVVTSDPIPHITMRTGTVSDVAREVYGKHLNVIEILHLNVIPRPLQIPIGTRLLVPRPPGTSFRRRSLGTSV
jgi:hypothetical protein